MENNHDRFVNFTYRIIFIALVIYPVILVMDTPIDALPHTSAITIRRLKSLGIETYGDLIDYIPHSYKDYSLIAKINSLQPGETPTVIGTITDAKYQFTRTGLRIQHFILEDETGKIDLIWFNQPYLMRLLTIGSKLAVSGEVKEFGRKFQLFPAEYELFNGTIRELKHTGRIIPVYSEKRGISSKTIREKIWSVLKLMKNPEDIPDPFPSQFVVSNGLIGEYTAYQQVHFPENQESHQTARKRLAFDELFIIQLSHELVRREWLKETVTHSFEVEIFSSDIDRFIASLAFELTSAQKRVLNEITDDLKKTKPMNRFLQGEVGSGKTIIAAISSYIAFKNGYQSLIMAPTEILAQQHYNTISKLFKGTSPHTILVTGSSKPSRSNLQSADIIVGTQAIIQKSAKFDKVGLVIVDEQHRFGVAQRAMLKKKGINPHLLTMTATPIPRTVMLTLYGELDISIIDEMPKGRLPVKTFLVQKNKRDDCYRWIMKQISEFNHQVYIICPLIEESESESMQSVKAAVKEFEHLQNDVFKNYRLGLLHGKMKPEEKKDIMEKFNDKKFDILVTTSVVEVGVDIPNATVMLIEGSERFGLAQLHQLRGRVGRSLIQSYCFLFTDTNDASINERLTFFSKTNDGNTLAEKDLQLRGPGNIFGEKQHGYLCLNVASLSDKPLIQKTKKAMGEFLETYSVKDNTVLTKRIEKYQATEIAKD